MELREYIDKLSRGKNVETVQCNEVCILISSVWPLVLFQLIK